MSQKLIPLNKPEMLLAAGVPFSTEHQARWALRRASENGLSMAFIRIGRRIYLDPSKFHELVRQENGVK